MNIREVDPSTSPLAAFGVQLRRFRTARRLTQDQLGRHVNYSGAYVSCVERADRVPSAKFAALADGVLETGGTLALMWWHLGHESLIDGFPEFAQQEAVATELRLFELAVIPGLLQTERYATALVSAAMLRGSISQEQAAERIAFRLARQRLLTRTPAPLLHVVLDESALCRTVGGPQVMAEQLGRLERLAQRPGVVIQVAPFALGERVPFTLPVTLLTLRDGTNIGYTETLQRGFLDRDVETVAEWTKGYDQLQVDALPQPDSLAMIRARRKELCNMAETPGTNGAAWLKSSYSNGGGQCIEIAPGHPGVVPVRDSKDPSGPVLRMDRRAWAAFVAAAADGEFGEV
ncbi:Scr1 family TA system antitoxin-like transcriptional regulator [Kitasatospora sp. NPDC049258]|uniref:helix-turn-helix domain-containing protein n=1 Tax=Kitasatospora sp. NPDC049258 TaxID=3155394 RepID=UPI003432662A